MVKKRSAHLITSRSKGGVDRLIIMLAVTFFFIFTLCSVYVVTIQPSNAAAWSMAVFFIVGLFLLLAHEDNVFPDIPRKKLPHAVITWFFAWIFIAYFVSFLITMQMGYMVLAICFGTIVALGGSYVFMNEAQWTSFKTNVKSKTGGRIKKAIKNTKTGRKLEKRKQLKIRRKRANKKKRRIQGW